MCGRTDSKYTWLLYLRSLFSLATIKPLEAAGLGKISHISLASMGIM